MSMYFQLLRSIVGQQYQMAIVVLLLALFTLLLLRDRVKMFPGYPLVATLVVLILAPTYMIVLRILGVPYGAYLTAYQIVPALALAAAGLTWLGYRMQEKLGKKAWVCIVLAVLLIASQPWTYNCKGLIKAPFTQAKVDAEVYDLADLMGAGMAYMPADLATQFCEIQSETNVIYGSEYAFTATETPSDMVEALQRYGMEYLVCPREADNGEWFGGYGYGAIGETEHYIVYARLTNES